MTLSELFKQVIQRLEEEGIRFALAGGMAAIPYRGQSRTTNDLDFLFFVEKEGDKAAIKIIESLGLKGSVVRQADLAGGPMFAIKRKSTAPVIVVGRDPSNPKGVGVDFLLPSLPWFENAFRRAQSNQIDFGFGRIPSLTVEDVIITKLFALHNNARRFKDLDDLQEIFRTQHDIDWSYVSAEMVRFQLSIPKEVIDLVTPAIARVSKRIRKSGRQKS